MGSRTKKDSPGSLLSSASSSSDLAETVRSLSPQQRRELSRLLSAKRRGTPFPGPQTLALENKADILLYGGAPGGGKTDLLLGLAPLHHRRAIQFPPAHGGAKGGGARSPPPLARRAGV